MSKNIWIINEYASSPKYEGIYYRHYYLAKEFKNLGYKSTIITSSYSHFLKKYPNMNGKTYQLENIDGIDYLWIKVMHYTKSFDKKRVFKWFEFMSKLFLIGRHIDSKPDVILCSPTAPFSILPAYFLAKKYKAKLVFEVRDIWPLTLIELGGFSKTNPFIKFMGWFEKFALKNADILVSNLSNYSEHVKNLGFQKEAHWISNGINVDEMKNIEQLPNEVSSQIPKKKFIVGYTGKLGVSNAIDYFINTARLLEGNTNICFVIVGDGQEKENLIQRANGLSNVIFIDSIKKSQVQSMLTLFDVCFIGLHKESLFKYGVSPNKLFDYMYASKPIIHSIDTTNDLVSMYNCGISVEAENTIDIKNAIEQLYKMSNEKRLLLGENGKKAVLEHFTYEKLAKKYSKIIEKNK